MEPEDVVLEDVILEVALPPETVNKLNLLTDIINQHGCPCYGDNQYGGRKTISLNEILHHVLGNLADGVVPAEENKWEQSLLTEFGLSPCCSVENIKEALAEFDKNNATAS